MKITNISVLRKNLFITINSVIEYNEPITVSTKNGNAVIISENEYNSLLETVYLSSIPNLVKNIKNGEKEDINRLPVYKPNEEWSHYER